MARFIGSVEGNRGEATRLGHKTSGLTVVAASYAGCITVYLYVDDDDRDCARVAIGEWQGTGPSPSITLWDGPFNMAEELRDQDPVGLMVREAIKRQQVART